VAPPRLAWVQSLLDARAFERDPMSVREVLWSSRFRVHHRIADRYLRAPGAQVISQFDHRDADERFTAASPLRIAVVGSRVPLRCSTCLTVDGERANDLSVT
jgi:hypothetical protein